MSQAYDYVCTGLTILDILGRHIAQIPPGGKTEIIEQIRITAAGTAAGPAVIGARYGLKTALVGAIGSDDMGFILETMLKNNGVDASLLQRRTDMPTAATMLAVAPDGQRPNFHAIGASVMLELDQARTDAIVNSRFVHWGGVGTMLMLDGGPGAQVLKQASENGAVITCDFITPGPGSLDALKLVMPYVDYFMPSLDEAMEVAETSNADDTAKFYMDAGAKACILKDGAKGSLLYANGGKTRIPALKVDVLDTTGCGDAYCAGFAAGLAQGWDPEKACRFAAAASALVATGLGSDAGVTDFQSTLDAMENLETLD
ncbi:Sugar or nucleoside kinase, ribokinase family [Desulfatibacillum alkenivorans DSM 16219]|jgi:sugar/nucleoside kinase (ribokinase family)|uniref:Sugar or nucleoside kinase, ribokinase family n=1 Tax=Desulfatibacillum alkenivorans DSM 16219 TaxID=1121393 RepID=A0A1M6KGU2_9BACT|nr:PfkB family carbohydrate kinase [Desulfatibacillum alkenivorans]SHJ58138.1 Sugar or nucleoside kinase, ribokinase family [Desulfatibacillum alkenivorans DSM 16219]